MSQRSAQLVAKNTLYLFARMLVVTLVQLYASRVILHTLGFEDYGIYNVVGSIVVFCGFLNTALHNATSRYITYDLGREDFDSLSKTYTMGIKCHALLAIVLFVLMEIVGVWFVNTHLNIPSNRIWATNWLFQFSLITFCVHIITVPFNANIVAHERMNVYAAVSVVDALLKLSIVFALVVSPIDKLISYSILLLMESLLLLYIQILYCRQKLMDTKFLYRFWDKKKLWDFSNYSGLSMVVNGADGATLQCRSIFFNWFLGTIANAALGIANQVISLVSVFVATFSQSFRPQIIKSYAAGDKPYFFNLVYSTSKICYYMFLGITLPIVLNLSYILSLWLGTYPYHTEGFIIAILLYYLIDAFQQPLWTAVHATGKLKTHQLLIGGIKILAIPIMYISLYIGHSAEFTLYLWAGLNGVAAVARIIYMRTLIKLSLLSYAQKVIMPIFLVTLSVVPIALGLSKIAFEPFPRLLITSSGSALFLCASIYLLGLNSAERRMCKKLVNKYLKISS